MRRIARENGLEVHDKPDSQNFAGGELPRPARGRPRRRGGEIRDSSGRVLGRHPGIGSFTVGQRRGLGVALGEPLYVTRLDRDTQTVFVGPERELYRRALRTSRVNWVSVAPPAQPLRAGVRIRYQGVEAPAR